VFPQTRPLTQERLNQLPAVGDDCTLAILGTLRLPDGETPGAIWLIHSYMSEEDIAEGVLIVPEGFAISEHGSILGRELLHMGGEILNAPTPTDGGSVARVQGCTERPTISLKEALEYTNKPWKEALDRVCNRTTTLV
jgi:hypothetical protein